ncbi:Adrenodoxin, mitochondrial [Portunus trituberculatus]|uniref:Adrenodoxin, mitochondrial n=1 Tax=Portunus trituberculatus TaxID=210409 RepID=A0A5B7DDF6_PORTR|nr:Adrenodoxin, mitochondrial [Portunus trituberculatus]
MCVGERLAVGQQEASCRNWSQPPAGSSRRTGQGSFQALQGHYYRGKPGFGGGSAMRHKAYTNVMMSRLGCQVCLNKKLNGITVKVPEGVADARTAYFAILLTNSVHVQLATFLQGPLIVVKPGSVVHQELWEQYLTLASTSLERKLAKGNKKWGKKRPTGLPVPLKIIRVIQKTQCDGISVLRGTLRFCSIATLVVRCEGEDWLMNLIDLKEVVKETTSTRSLPSSISWSIRSYATPADQEHNII